jgi:hemerythrin-like domain-containing protein
MVEIIEILRQEHRNIEKLLSVLEQELIPILRKADSLGIPKSPAT